jgi:hypothetical protein
MRKESNMDEEEANAALTKKFQEETKKVKESREYAIKVLSDLKDRIEKGIVL